MDPQLQQRLMMFGGYLPGGISLLVLLSGWYLHALRKSKLDHIDEDPHNEYEDEMDEDQPRVRASDGPRWLLALLLLIGYAGADHAANDVFHLWPDSNSYRFTHAIGLIAVVGVLEGFIRLPILAGFFLRAIVYAGAFWMLSEGYVSRVFGGMPTFMGATIFVALGASLIASASDRGNEETPAWVDAITWLVIMGASMPIYLYNHFSTGAMIPAGIIAVLISAGFVGLIFRDLRLGRGGVTVLVGVMLTMLTGSIIQTGSDVLPALMLLSIAPMVTAIPLDTLSSLRTLLVRLVLLAAILGSAGGLMYWASQGNESGGEVDPHADYQSEPDIGADDGIEFEPE